MSSFVPTYQVHIQYVELSWVELSTISYFEQKKKIRFGGKLFGLVGK